MAHIGAPCFFTSTSGILDRAIPQVLCARHPHVFHDLESIVGTMRHNLGIFCHTKVSGQSQILFRLNRRQNTIQSRITGNRKFTCRARRNILIEIRITRQLDISGEIAIDKKIMPLQAIVFRFHGATNARKLSDIDRITAQHRITCHNKILCNILRVSVPVTIHHGRSQRQITGTIISTTEIGVIKICFLCNMLNRQRNLVQTIYIKDGHFAMF